MKSEKQRKKLKCFEARFGSGDELPFKPDRTRLSNQGAVIAQAQPHCYMLNKVELPDEYTVVIDEPFRDKPQ